MKPNPWMRRLTGLLCAGLLLIGTGCTDAADAVQVNEPDQETDPEIRAAMAYSLYYESYKFNDYRAAEEHMATLRRFAPWNTGPFDQAITQATLERGVEIYDALNLPKEAAAFIEEMLPHVQDAAVRADWAEKRAAYLE